MGYEKRLTGSDWSTRKVISQTTPNYKLKQIIMTIEQIAKLDQYKEHELHDVHNPHCSECYKEDVFVKYNCYICEDKGYILKTNWANTDNSYDVEVRCSCQE